MRLLILIFALLLGMPASAQTSTDVPAIRDTIGAQIEAFQADDLPRAFSYASPSIRRLFQTPENFGAMVEGGYPSIWRPSGIRYYDQTATGGSVIQRMIFLDADGQEHWFGYEMIQVEGSWKINGVYPLEAVDLNV